MSTAWVQGNQAYTAAAMRRVAALLSGEDAATVAALDRHLAGITESMPRPPALTSLVEAFGLSNFESDLLIMCAGVELDDSVRRAITHPTGPAAEHAAGRDAAAGRMLAPTFDLALARLPDAHWSAITPASALRRWHLVEVGPGDLLMRSPLRITERVLHHLTGVHYVDESSGLRLIAPGPDLAAGQADVAGRAADCLTGAAQEGPPAVQIVTRRRTTGQAVAAAIAEHLGLTAGFVRADDLPSSAPERRELARGIEREAVLAGVLPVLDALGGYRESQAWAARLADEVAGPVVLIVTEPLEVRRDDVRLAVPAATPDERMAVWTAALGPAGARLNGHLSRAAELFDLDPAAIRATARQFAAQAGTGAEFWDLARGRARPRLEHLTERVDSAANWDLLVLPEPQRATLREIAAQARWRGKVHREWGFGADGAPGLGISVLFHGPSGTGKSLAAGVIANELGLDLYRIDLSRVVSKYIGETEKNLGTVFEEAEGAGAVLLFDEADALFGRRSEVRDSHDRYANLEVSYLLQRMEAYDGLAILTTNQRSALDPAFLRRLRFAVQFPFPDQPGRAEIWRRIFPAGVPIADLDFERLAQLNVAGGNIRTMALNAAFHAAAAGSGVRMDHVLLAARSEFAKLERQLPEAQVRGWT